MNAFDRAWALLKEYRPDWRYQAEALPILSDDDLKRISQQWLEDTGQTDPMEIKDYPSGDKMKYVLPYPDKDDFVVKRPRMWNTLTRDENLQRHLDRLGDKYRGKNLVQELEDLGFPVVSEYNVGDRYLLQPSLVMGHTGGGSHLRENTERPELRIADNTLYHIVADRHNENWGLDQTGNWRMFDVEMGIGEPSDYWPETAENLGEELQMDLDKLGIEIPASRLLNFMSHIDHERPKMQHFLETIEPHSANPNYVTIDGKPVWREGY